MNFEFTNNELFVLCALGGATEVVGVANPFVAMQEDDVYALSGRIVQKLEADGHIERTEEGCTLNDSAKLIVELISDSFETYIIGGDESEDYVFVKGQDMMHMKNVGFENCYINIFSDQNEMKNFFKSQFGFFKAHTDSMQYMLSIPSDTMDKAISKAEDGKMDEAVEILDGDDFEKDEIMNMLHSIIFPELSKIIVCRRKAQARSSESIFKICGTDKGAWIVKISTYDEGVNTLVYKATDDDITKIIFEV